MEMNRYIESFIKYDLL